MMALATMNKRKDALCTFVMTENIDAVATSINVLLCKQDQIKFLQFLVMSSSRKKIMKYK
jgi:hypothetical protein